MAREEEIVFSSRPMNAGKGKVTVKDVPLSKIKLSRNSRMDIKEEELAGLMGSIKEEGLLEPIGLVKSNGGYEICYGNRRYLACSKLGYHSIPAIIHESQNAADIDIKNLTENVQRRGVSFTEVGRYISGLRSQGLTDVEIGVRMGVSQSYINSCLMAFNDVPTEFRKSLEVRIPGTLGKLKNTKSAKGKISLKTARMIMSAEKSGQVTMLQAKDLLREARDSDSFNPEFIKHYVHEIQKGRKDYLKASDRYKNVRLTFSMKQSDYDDLVDKFCVEGAPFKNPNELMYAILRGEKAVKIKMVRIKK